jgi:hypothetical protein
MAPVGEVYCKEVGEWRGGVYFVAVYPFLLDKTEGHRGAIFFAKGVGGIL